jgi:hypothetical protein
MKFGVVVFAPHEIFDFVGTPRMLSGRTAP